MRALTHVTGDPFARDHWTPGHFTASAFVLSPDRAKLLLILHGKLHRWLQPGGHIEPDDVDVFAAAQREVAEEVGLPDLPHADGPSIFDVDVHRIPPIGSAPAHRHFDVRVLLLAPDLRATAGSDAKEARWVPLADVARWETDESVLRAVRKFQR
jgi:8-oxo-dGTP pyrophosphatase MutT (NUDIX family)